jgi:hypothetical protein
MSKNISFPNKDSFVSDWLCIDSACYLPIALQLSGCHVNILDMETQKY